MAASLDLLVQDGKISWESTVHSVIAEFQHVQQPAEYSGMTVRDICSHRTGLFGLDEITQGLDGRQDPHRQKGRGQGVQRHA